jgi:hypothetical protein
MDTEPASEQYAYLLSEVSGGSSRRPSYEIGARIDVDPAHYGMAALVAGLGPWAIERLTRLRWDTGLYYAELTSVDDDGDPDQLVSDRYIPWCGGQVLVGGGGTGNVGRHDE